jgi:hypothetical protein
MTRLTPYQPGRKTYPPLPGHLRRQWEAIVPSIAQRLEYRPCSAALKTGAVIACLYVMDAQVYIDNWGVWPEDDPGKQYVRIEDIVSISESPFRLPVAFATELYRAGETGMGYCAFTLVFVDGFEMHFVGGGALDFISLPKGRRMTDIVRVVPHSGRGHSQVATPKYHWCLFGCAEGRAGIWRFA